LKENLIIQKTLLAEKKLMDKKTEEKL